MRLGLLPRILRQITNGAFTPTLSSLSLSSFTIAENSAAGTVVGNITGTTGGSSLSLSDSAGSRFAISSGRIVAGATSTDYETATSHSITIVETLAGATGSPKSTTLTITVTDVADGGLGVPTLAFDTPLYGNPPTFVFTTAADAILGDYGAIEWATNSSFTSSTTEWHTLTSDEVINGSATWPINSGTALADGTIWARPYAGRGGTPPSPTSVSSAGTTITRAVYDGIPTTWDFVDQTAVATSSTITSAAVTPTGYTGATTVLTNGNLVSIAGGTFSTADTTISPGQSIAVRGTSSSTAGTATTLTINVAGVDVTFQMVTASSGVSFNTNATQPASVTTSNTLTYTFTSQSLGAGTAVVCLGAQSGTTKISALSITPTGGGTTVNCTMKTRTTSGDSMEIWTSNSALSAGTYDILITYTGFETSHRIMHGFMSGQDASTTVIDTCMLLAGSGHTTPHTASDSLTVPTNGVGIVYELDATSTSANFTCSGFTIMATVPTAFVDTAILRSTATGTPSFASANGYSGILGVSFGP